jgi:hypothetical protein
MTKVEDVAPRAARIADNTNKHVRLAFVDMLTSKAIGNS